MATFGGIQFQSNQQIADFVDANSQDFIAMVRSYSILIGGSISDQQIINKLLQEAYPRIGMKLAAAKNLNNEYLFSNATAPFDLTALFLNVVNLITNPSSPFSEGLVSVAARYAASSLISSIPLDSDIKNVTLARDINAQAHQDLQDIVELYQGTAAQAVAVRDADVPALEQTLYISTAIDPTSLPASYFNIDPPREAILDINSLFPSANVKVLDSLTLTPGKIGVCEWSITSNIRQAGALLKGAFFIVTGDNTETILDGISSGINTATSLQQGNLLAAPNSNTQELISTAVMKKNVYVEGDSADPTGIYDKKQINLTLVSKIDSLAFDTRTLSSINTNELLIVDFYTLDLASVATSINSSSIYQGAYSALTSYVPGDVVLFNDVLYVSILASLGVAPLTSANWTRLYQEALDVTAYKYLPSTLQYIPGLIYGLQKDFGKLTPYGPVSLLLSVNKGTVSSMLGAADADAAARDTFYFKLIDPSTPITATIKCRISSAASPTVEEFSLELIDAYPQDIALALINALFTLRSAADRVNVLGLAESVSDTLGVMVFPFAVQIASFKYTLKSVRTIVDLGIDGIIPDNLLIATGSSYMEYTKYTNAPRSIIVDATPEKQYTLLQATNLALDNNYVYSSRLVTMESNSSALTAARDRIKLLQGRPISP